MLVGTATLTLTFTNSSRFIEFYVVRGIDGNITDRWRETGSWTATEDTVAKTSFVWDEQNDQRFEDANTVNKNYTWGDEAGDVLFIHNWGSNDEDDSYRRGTRIKDPITYPLTGVWKGYRVYDDANNKWWTFTLGDSFTEHFDNGTVNFLLTGNWRIDEKNMFLFVTAESASSTRDGVVSEEFDPSEFVGHELRYAYAPSGIANTIIFSPFGNERRYDDATSTWVEREGVTTSERYWMLLERQP